MASRKREQYASLPPFESYLEQLDLEKVVEAIVTVEAGAPKMAEFDLEEAKRMIWAAAEKWLSRDIYDMQIEGVELPFKQLIGPHANRGILDIYGTLRGRIPLTKDYEGKKFVVDWKSSSATLDATWRQRYIDSWQGRLYGMTGEAALVIFRGINRKTELREVLVEVPLTNNAEVTEYYTGLSVMRQGLIDSKMEVWPRHMPQACHTFGRECPEYDACQQNTMPRQAIAPDTWSYSSSELFLLCPERYRRSRIRESYESSEESEFGSAVHRGLAELYTQVKNRFMNEQ